MSAFGNLVSHDPQSRNSARAHALRCDLKREPDGRVQRTNLRSLPVHLWNRPVQDGSFDCRILPFRRVLAPLAGVEADA